MGEIPALGIGVTRQDVVMAHFTGQEQGRTKPTGYLLPLNVFYDPVRGVYQSHVY